MHAPKPADLFQSDQFENSELYRDLLAIGGHGVSRVASARQVVVARMTGEDMNSTHCPQCVILLVPAIPCRLAIRTDQVSDQLLRLCPNTLVILRPGFTYDVQYIACDRFLAMAIDTDWFEEVAEDCSASAPLADGPALDTVLHPDIPAIVAALRRHLAFPRTPHERFLQLNVELLISHYFWHQSLRDHYPPLSSGLSNGRLQTVLEHIEGGLDDRILVADLAKDANMTPSQFSRAFKTKLGISPQSYILERRVVRVQDLLEGTSMPLAELSYETGFSSQAHMTAAFAKHFGITPGEYRKFINDAETSNARTDLNSQDATATA